MIKIFYALILLATGFYAVESSAQIFTLKFNADSSFSDPLFAQAITAISAEIKQVEDKINDGLPKSKNPERLMQGMANSSVMAGKGVGSDYASEMSVLLIGAGAGVGADLEKNKEAKSDLSGVGVQAGIMIGTNLSWMDTATILGLDTNRINIYGNFFKYDMNNTSKDTTIKGKISSYGVHASYDWIPRSPSKLFGWGGVKIHTGYEYNKMDVVLNSKIEEDISAETPSVPDATFNATLNANPFASVNVATHSIPIEISTSFRFLYLFTLYGGLGADFNTGSAMGKGDLNSTLSEVRCNETNASSGCGTLGDGGLAGEIEAGANIDGKGKVKAFTSRAFAGVQFNLPYFLIFVQGDKELGSNLVGATAGARFSF